MMKVGANPATDEETLKRQLKETEDSLVEQLTREFFEVYPTPFQYEALSTSGLYSVLKPAELAWSYSSVWWFVTPSCWSCTCSE